MTNVEYHRPGMNDLQELCLLERACFPAPWDPREMAALLADSPELRTLGAFCRGVLAGYVSAVISPTGYLHVISLGVLPDHRRKGIASQLLSSAIQWGRHLGASAVFLEVRKKNGDARDFYSRWDFQVLEELTGFYGPGQDGLRLGLEVSPIPGTAQVVSCLNRVIGTRPRLGVVLGSGLGWATEPFGAGAAIPFSDIPGMSGDAVAGHAHRLQLSADGSIVFVMGRRHHYQGYDGREVVVLPAALACLGVDRWLLTSSSGAVDPAFRTGDAMVFTDHINYSGCIPDPPLEPAGGDVYSESLRRVVIEEMPDCREGVFACVSGPAYETAAEVELIRRNGCSAVSMSTAQEAMALRALGCRVSALSLITNAVDSGDTVCHEEVLSAQEILRKRQEKVLISLLERLSGELQGG